MHVRVIHNPKNAKEAPKCQKYILYQVEPWHPKSYTPKIEQAQMNYIIVSIWLIYFQWPTPLLSKFKLRQGTEVQCKGIGTI